MSLNYVEPGVYTSNETTKDSANTDASVKMYPLVVGRIPKNLPKTLNVVRVCGGIVDGSVIDYDEIDTSYFNISSVESVKSAYNSSKSYAISGSYFKVIKDESNGKIGFKWYPYSQKYQKYETSFFQLLSTEPSDWSEDCTKYYKLGEGVVPDNGWGENGPYEAVDASTTFAEGTYYEKKEVNSVIEEGVVGIESEADIKTSEILISEAEASDYVRTTISYTQAIIDNAEAGLIPALGTAYKVKFYFTPSKDSEYYKIQAWKGASGVSEFYGSDTLAVDYTDEGVGYNPLSVAATILEEAGSKNFFTLAITEPEVQYLTNDEGKYIGPGETANDNGEYSEVIIDQNDESARYIKVAVGTEEITDGYRYLSVLQTNQQSAYITVTGDKITPINIAGVYCIPASNNYKIDYDATFAAMYEDALDEKCTDIEAESLYRIIPTNQGKKIALAVSDHVIEFSSDEERMECGAFISLPYNALSETSYNTYIDNCMNFVSSLQSARLIMSYGSAKRELSNGMTVNLNTQFIMCYIAALEQKKTDGTGLTNTSIPLTSFRELDAPSMRRTRKNEIASNGILVLEQRPSTAAIKIRHALTTLYSDKYGKEMSVQYNIDYTRKYLRSICSPYIGRRNVTSETVELVEQTISEGLEVLVNEGRLTFGTISDIGISEDSEDTIVVTLKVKVAFPLNYIYITLVLDN